MTHESNLQSNMMEAARDFENPYQHPQPMNNLEKVINEIRSNSKKLDALHMFVMCVGGNYNTQAFKLGLGLRHGINHGVSYEAMPEWETLMGELDYRDPELTDYDPHPTPELKGLIELMRREIKTARAKDEATEEAKSMSGKKGHISREYFLPSGKPLPTYRTEHGRQHGELFDARFVRTTTKFEDGSEDDVNYFVMNHGRWDSIAAEEFNKRLSNDNINTE